MINKYITLQIDKDPLTKGDCYRVIDETSNYFYVKRYDSIKQVKIYKHNLKYRIIPVEQYKQLPKYRALE